MSAATLPSHLDFLAREVPRWERENHCFSCHNNGDGARALYSARRKGYAVPVEALTATTEWLRHPEQWAQVKSTAGSTDKNLARIQFASALAEAWRSRDLRDPAALRAAAKVLAENQAPDGSWPVDVGSLPGAPATYGTPLATYLAREVLKLARGHSASVARADRWLASAKPASLTDAAALLLADRQRGDCRDLLLKSQTADGGWGAQRGMPAEAFDTALALLALRGRGDAARGARAFLLKLEGSDGAWPETTRPPGGISYAERISTAAWVSMALL